MSREVRRISVEQHSGFLDGVIASDTTSVSFLQLPEWGNVKVGWRPESVGWFEDSTLVGVALVLYRPIPKLPQRSLAYVPEGPVIDWESGDLSSWLSPLVSHVKGRGAFQLKMGPPVAIKQWDAQTIKSCNRCETSRCLEVFQVIANFALDELVIEVHCVHLDSYKRKTLVLVSVTYNHVMFFKYHLPVAVKPNYSPASTSSGDVMFARLKRPVLKFQLERAMTCLPFTGFMLRQLRVMVSHREAWSTSNACGMH